MTASDTVFATPPTTRPVVKSVMMRPPLATRTDQPCKKQVILDMGEASREQGFRLNGCR